MLQAVMSRASVIHFVSVSSFDQFSDKNKDQARILAFKFCNLAFEDFEFLFLIFGNSVPLGGTVSLC